MANPEAELQRLAAEEPWWTFCDRLRAAMANPAAFGYASGAALLEQVARLRGISVPTLRSLLDARSAADRSGLDVQSEGFAASPSVALMFRRVFVLDRQRAEEIRASVHSGEISTAQLKRELSALRARGAAPQPDEGLITSARGRGMDFERRVGLHLHKMAAREFGESSEVKPFSVGTGSPMDFEIYQDGALKCGVAVRSGASMGARTRLFEMFAAVKLYSERYPLVWLIIPAEWNEEQVTCLQFFDRFYSGGKWPFPQIRLYVFCSATEIERFTGPISAHSYLEKQKKFL